MNPKEKLIAEFGKPIANRITARKMGGGPDQWDIFIDGRRFITSISKFDVNYYKGKACQSLKDGTHLTHRY